MPRRKLQYSTRIQKGSPYWYYRLEGWKDYKPTDIRIRYKSGLPTNKREAETWALEKWKAHTDIPRGSGDSLGVFLAPYFIPGKCPHMARIIGDTGRFSEAWAGQLRRGLNTYILPDPVSLKPVGALKPGDFEDLKNRLKALNVSKKEGAVKHLSARMVNILVGAVKTALREGYHRGDIPHNPMEGVGKLREDPEETGIFTPEELRRLLSGPSPFKSRRSSGIRRGRQPEDLAHAFFLICALVGERPEAILSLRWRDIEEDVLFFESTKTKQEGRRVPVVPAVREALENLRGAEAPPDSYIFGYEDGTRCTKTWYRTRFLAAMKAAGLPALDGEGRKRVPYSFKHSLITHLIDNGADEVLVREYVGHSHGTGFGRILTRTQRRYKHAQTERLRLLLPEIEKIFIDKPNIVGL